MKELLFSNPANKHENELNANFGNGISIYLNVLIEIQNYGNLIFKNNWKKNKNLNRWFSAKASVKLVKLSIYHWRYLCLALFKLLPLESCKIGFEIIGTENIFSTNIV